MKPAVKCSLPLLLLVIASCVLAQSRETKPSAYPELPYVWGKAKDGIRVALVPFKSGRQTEVEAYIGRADEESRAFYAPRLYTYRKPPSISITLRDSVGNEVPKTAKGRSYPRSAKPLHINSWMVMMQQQPLSQIEIMPNSAAIPIQFFNVSECFALKLSGRYELEVKVLVLTNTADDHYEPVDVPPATLTLDLPASQCTGGLVGPLVRLFGLLLCAAGAFFWLYRRLGKGHRSSTTGGLECCTRLIMTPVCARCGDTSHLEPKPCATLLAHGYSRIQWILRHHFS